MSLISVALLCMCVCAVNAYSLQRIKDKQCSFKGQKYSVGTFPSKDGCNTCTCKSSGKVRCTKKKCCKYDGQQYSVGKFQNKDGCKCQCIRSRKVNCKKCVSPKQCTSNGILYNDGDTFKDKCNFCTCKNGQADCTRKYCPTTCISEDGNTYMPGESVPSTDTCMKCTCHPGGITRCLGPTCLVPKCSKPIYVEGECCATCQSETCISGDGKTYMPGESVPSTDPCVKCTCHRGGITRCLGPTCPVLKCNKPTYVEGECCASCPSETCISEDGNAYMPGESVPSTDTCMKCTCHPGGITKCLGPSCLVPKCSKPIYVEGECCATCQSETGY